MTRIDFHTGVADKLQFACRLLRRATNEGARLVVYCNDEGELSRLDQALWTFSEQDFLPHVRADDALAAATPIILASGDELDVPHHDVLVNLGLAAPVNFASFKRLIEIVSRAEDEVMAGRERYSHYRQRGYPLKHIPWSTND